jgi:hypothetical protein
LFFNFSKISTERAIRQEREERRINKQRKLEQEAKVEPTKKVSDETQEEAKKGRNFTVSIAIPGSIIGNIISRELKTYVAGQVKIQLLININ